MKENESALYSQYIIDGIRCSATPAELLEECMDFDGPQEMPVTSFDDIVDESTEPPLSACTYEMGRSSEYISRIVPLANADRPFRMLWLSATVRLSPWRKVLPDCVFPARPTAI